MATFAVRVASIDGKGVGLFGLRAWLEKRVAAFAAEKVLLMVRALAKGLVVDGHVARVNDGCLAMKALMGVFLIQLCTRTDLHRGSPGGNRRVLGARTS